MPVIVRFAPSPTGPLHLGSARTALFNYLFAKKQDGKIYLRIEDTDRERSKPEFEQNIIESLEWLGLKFDNPQPIRQSERVVIYQRALEKLIAGGAAYVSREVSNVNKRGEVIRFNNPGQLITFQDLIRGEITFNTKELGDFVIAKSLAEPLYHLAVVADDCEMGVTHVIRGEDHISNTPRQILLCRAIGGIPPRYAHLPLILASDRTKLSKRHGGAVSVSEYRAQGYLPEALINFLALLGWSPQAENLEQEIFSITELIQHFDLKKVQSSPAIFNLDRLNWFNKEYLKRFPRAKLETLINGYLPDINHELLNRLLPELMNRIHRLDEITDLVKAGELDYFFNQPKIKKEMLKTVAHLPQIIKLLAPMSADQFTPEQIKNAVWDFANKMGRGEVLWPMRVALTGRERSPDPFTVASIIGKEETLVRLEYASQI